MITKRIIKYLWVLYVLYLLIGSLVVRFNFIDLVYIVIFLTLIIYGNVKDNKTLEEE